MADASRFPLETPRRLSQSVLWRLQRRYFERRGAAAWAEGEVPHQVTNSPYLARAYRRIIAGFLRDWQPVLDPAHPVYVVELGAGPGRLAFHVMRQLAEPGAAPPPLAVRYVMTDFAEANLAAWRDHPQLAAWFADGRLDLARFDAAHDTELLLERSGAILAPGALRNPLIVIANYVFDSLPVDLFAVDGGRLAEWQVRLCSTRPDTDLDDPDVLGRAALACEPRAIEPAGYYGDAALDRLLDEHRARLPDTAFGFPSASLGCLARLAALAGGRLLVLSADKGEIDEAGLRAQSAPNITLHGCFSVAVNFHAIARWVADQGGAALLPGARPSHIASCGFALGAPPGGLGAPPGGWAATRAAYADELDRVRPDHLIARIRALDHEAPALSLDGWLAHLRFHACDPAVVRSALPHLAPRVAAATPAERAELRAVLAEAWDGYLHIGEPDDLGLALGRLAAATGAWRDAVRFLEGSLRWYGPTGEALAALDRCRAALALAADPGSALP